MKYSLCIGINKHKNHGKIPNLSFAVADAQEMNSIFKMNLDSESIDKIENQHLLIDENATRENIIQLLDNLIKTCTDQDKLFFYYAGHGSSEIDKDKRPENNDDRLRKYLVPYDTDISALDSSAIDFNFLTERLNRIRAEQMVIIFDCCYSGAMGGRTFSLPGTRVVPQEIGKEFLTRLSGKGRVVMAACAGSEVAKEKEIFNHGIFTNFIIQGLRGEADYYRDGHIDDNELWLYVLKSTIDDTKGEQNPVKFGHSVGKGIFINQVPSRLKSQLNKDFLEDRITNKFSQYRLKIVRISDKDDNTSLGEVAANYIKDLTSPSTKIAVSCGRTLIETISQLQRSSKSNIKIFPLNGSPTDEVRLTDSMVLTYLLWSKFEPNSGAVAKVVPTGIPPSLTSLVKTEIDALVKSILIEAKESDIFLFGLGTPKETNTNITYLLQKSNSSYESLADMGAIGEINFQLYNKNGEFLLLDDSLNEKDKEIIKTYNSKFFSLHPIDLLEISKRPGVNIIVVAGGQDKREAIVAGIRGGFIRSLITDFDTAEWLFKYAKTEV